MIITGCIAYGMVAAAFVILYLFTNELIPTVVRGTMFGTLGGIGRLGCILATQIQKLASYGQFIPGLVFGFFTLLAGILVCTLPETLNQPLTETLDEAELFMRKSSATSLGTGQRTDRRKLSAPVWFIRLANTTSLDCTTNT